MKLIKNQKKRINLGKKIKMTTSNWNNQRFKII